MLNEWLKINTYCCVIGSLKNTVGREYKSLVQTFNITCRLEHQWKHSSLIKTMCVDQSIGNLHIAPIASLHAVQCIKFLFLFLSLVAKVFSPNSWYQMCTPAYKQGRLLLYSFMTISTCKNIWFYSIMIINGKMMKRPSSCSGAK